MATALVADQELQQELGPEATPQRACDGIPTFWVARGAIHEAVRHLRHVIPQPFKMLYDLTAIDERRRSHSDGQPYSDFTVVYHLFSFERNEYVRLKVPLERGQRLGTVDYRHLARANWYEREVWDMFGIVFEGHPHLTRILMPEDMDWASSAERPSGTGDGNGSVYFARRKAGCRAGGAALPP